MDKKARVLNFAKHGDMALADQLIEIDDKLLSVKESIDAANLSEIKAIQGEPGIDGVDGNRGSMFLGSFSTPAELPEDAMPYDWALVGGEVWQA